MKLSPPPNGLRAVEARDGEVNRRSGQTLDIVGQGSPGISPQVQHVQNGRIDVETSPGDGESPNNGVHPARKGSGSAVSVLSKAG